MLRYGKVVNTRSKPDLNRSLAQLRARLGACWLSSAQAAAICGIIPRVMAGTRILINILESSVFSEKKNIDQHEESPKFSEVWQHRKINPLKHAVIVPVRRYRM